MAKPLGITLPVRLGNRGYFETTTDVVVQIKSNLKNLLMTKRGERLGNPSFGCDIQLFIFNPLTDETISNIRGSIETAVQVWLPFLTIKNVSVTKDEDRNRMAIDVSFEFILGTIITDSILLEF